MKTRSIWIICLAVILVCFLVSRCHGQTFPLPNYFGLNPSFRLASPPMPPKVYRSTEIVKGGQKQLKIAVAALPPPVETITWTWIWLDENGKALPMPSPGIVFEILRSATFSTDPRAWQVISIMDRPPFTTTKAFPKEYFRARTKDVQSGITSDLMIDWSRK